MRAHDLRGTFVTLSLANGRTETWVADRTGHKSSQMINRYRRAARSATELGMGPLAPLFEAVPELRDCPGIAPKGSASSSGSRTKSPESRKKAEVAEWQTRRTQNPLGAIPCEFDSHLRHRRKGYSAVARLTHLLALKPRGDGGDDGFDSYALGKLALELPLGDLDNVPSGRDDVGVVRLEICELDFVQRRAVLADPAPLVDLTAARSGVALQELPDEVPGETSAACSGAQVRAVHRHEALRRVGVDRLDVWRAGPDATHGEPKHERRRRCHRRRA